MIPNLQPTLENELVKVRPLRVADFQELYNVARDPKIWEQHQNPDRYTLPVFKEFFKGAMDSQGAFVIIDRMTHSIIGSSRFKQHPSASDTVEIGWTFLSRDYWGGVYNSAFKKLMIAHAFQYFDYVVFNINKFNYRSQKAVEKLGGQLVIKSSALGHLHTKDPEGLTFVITKTAVA